MAKYLTNAAGTITEVSTPTTSAGSGDSGKIPSLDGAGRLDTSFMPTGIGADTAVIVASEALAAGDLVNIWNSTGAKVRKADATSAGKEAHGFVTASVLSSGNATVYFEGSNGSVTGLTPGVQYLTTTAGTASGTPPSGSGNVVQRVGFAPSATSLNFDSGTPIVLA
jgi:hypothetical protein